ncbi:hypothetical protein ACIA03_23390 [Nocardioides sp. NPDC051685]|uniref:hypothetical protein n=1 Tax=Nocardioides sp. NPDC051685 TaxID=3364334 RepID=UPI0037A6F864
MEYRTLVVPAEDVALLQAAIDLGGGTITHSCPLGNGDVAVTYVVYQPSRSTTARHIADVPRQ